MESAVKSAEDGLATEYKTAIAIASNKSKSSKFAPRNVQLFQDDGGRMFLVMPKTEFLNRYQSHVYQFAAHILHGWTVVHCDAPAENTDLVKNGQYKFCPAVNGHPVDGPNCVSYQVSELKTIRTKLGMWGIKSHASGGNTFDQDMNSVPSYTGFFKHNFNWSNAKRSAALWKERCERIQEKWVRVWKDKLGLR